MAQKKNVTVKWDVATDPIKSFRLVADYLHEQSKKRLLIDGIHAELVFVFKDDGDCVISLVIGDRDEFVGKIKRMIQQGNVVGIVHIAEAWMRISGHDDHITKQVLRGEIGVSDLLPEHRSEALMVMIQSRDRQSKTYVDPIQRDANGKPSLGKDGFEMSEIGGRFGKLFG
jgi:hypothetical protein